MNDRVAKIYDRFGPQLCIVQIIELLNPMKIGRVRCLRTDDRREGNRNHPRLSLNRQLVSFHEFAYTEPDKKQSLLKTVLPVITPLITASIGRRRPAFDIKIESLGSTIEAQLETRTIVNHTATVVLLGQRQQLVNVRRSSVPRHTPLDHLPWATEPSPSPLGWLLPAASAAWGAKAAVMSQRKSEIADLLVRGGARQHRHSVGSLAKRHPDVARTLTAMAVAATKAASGVDSAPRTACSRRARLTSSSNSRWGSAHHARP